jgi:hypothetical protein
MLIMRLSTEIQILVVDGRAVLTVILRRRYGSEMACPLVVQSAGKRTASHPPTVALVANHA